ncbi:MAG: rRNA maturation RNase YbeY [Cupriavidus sp.]|nr:MAG: rRNA maturation RNase YbeY [Cupriavidus sp.]
MSDIVVQRCVPAAGIPSAASLRHWAQSALRRKGALTIRIVDEDESEALNSRYRHKQKPTNVLSFGYDERGVLGDLVICAPIVEREAKEQGKTVRAHWAHMVVHGCLHLQGHDHEKEAEAAAMEALETRILGKLGFENPYQEQ